MTVLSHPSGESTIPRSMIFIFAVALAVVSTIGKVHAHDIYSGLKQPYTGTSCCADRD
jgi:hypothetical protein